MANRLDIIIFGATGFTGKHTVLEATTVLKDLTWGIAGRNEHKLKEVLKEIGQRSSYQLSKVPIIIADVKDQESLRKMGEKCKVLVNCCGPYRHFGEPVVKACLESGTHHVDVSGEPQYMETMQLKYNDLAKEKGLYVVSACGFDSIPTDMGAAFVEQHFDGVVNSIETYLETWVSGGNKSGPAVNYGTWESAIYGLAYANELRGIRAQLFKEKMPNLQPKLQKRPLLHKSGIVNGSYCLPFPSSDRSVFVRSQRILYEKNKKRPVQMKSYIAFRNLIEVVFVIMFGAIFGLLARFSIGRMLLLRYPKFFSGGFFSHEGPSEEKQNNTKFSLTLYAKGWSKEEVLSEPTDKHTNDPSKTMIATVTGSNPGYGATCVALLVAATTVLKEQSRMPGPGVLPPGAAFYKTNMITELQKYENGLKFEIVA